MDIVKRITESMLELVNLLTVAYSLQGVEGIVPAVPNEFAPFLTRKLQGFPKPPVPTPVSAPVPTPPIMQSRYLARMQTSPRSNPSAEENEKTYPPNSRF